MCGRFALAGAKADFVSCFDIVWEGELPPRYNIAPTQTVWTIRFAAHSPSQREVATARWGLIPSWAKDPTIGQRLINARCETLREKPAFREAVRQRRCLIPASGFYEWKREGTLKVPYYFSRPDGQFFAFAGLWERWRTAEGNWLTTCTIINTSANDWMRPWHERMPLILPPELWNLWLKPTTTDWEDLLQVVAAQRDPPLTMRPVSLAVNDVRRDDPSCLDPFIEPPPSSQLPRSLRRSQIPRDDQPSLWEV